MSKPQLFSLQCTKRTESVLLLGFNKAISCTFQLMSESILPQAFKIFTFCQLKAGGLFSMYDLLATTDVKGLTKPIVS